MKKYRCILKNIRKEKKISRLEIAGVIDRAEITVHRIENGSEIKLSEALEIAEYLKLPIEKIWIKI